VYLPQSQARINAGLYTPWLEFRVDLPWELLYADDLVVIAETKEDLIRGLMNGRIMWRIEV